MTKEKRVIVALDSNNFEKLNKLIDNIKDYIFGVKIGYEFFFNFGLSGYKKIQKKKINIFLDLKLHDIPNTVKNGVKAINVLKPYFTTIHISGGDQMQKIASKNTKGVKIIGVSVLTSLDDKQVRKYYSRKNVNKLVSDYTLFALKNKLDGIVCSPHEIRAIRKIARKKLIIITPGIRPSSYTNKKDQKRTMSPGKAVYLGADYLVIGRPITEAKNPKDIITQINLEIEKNKN